MDTNITFIKPLSTDFNTSASIIKATEYASIVEANNIISLAQAEANKIKQQAKIAASVEIAKGYAAGIASAKTDIAERLITSKIRANQMLELAETDLISLVKVTIERLFGQLKDIDKIEGMIQSSLSLMRSDYRVQVRVIPEMVDEMQARIPALIKDLKTLEYFEIVADASLNAEESVLEGDGGLIKCSVSKQFEKLNSLMERALGNNREL
jgi:type III secretion protein L